MAGHLLAHFPKNPTFLDGLDKQVKFVCFLSDIDCISHEDQWIDFHEFASFVYSHEKMLSHKKIPSTFWNSEPWKWKTIVYVYFSGKPQKGKRVGK